MTDSDYLTKEVEKTQVNLLVGGKAKRMNKAIKCLMKINGITLIERTLKQYADCGFKKFNILAGYGNEEVKNYIYTKSNYAKKIDLTFSLDDPTWEAGGKGKALKQALKNNVIDKNKRSVIVFPDDIFVDDRLPLKFVTAHLDNMKSHLVTVVTTPGTDYPYGEVKLTPSGAVEGFVEKPFVAKTTYTGLCVIELDVYSKINEMIYLESKTSQEFEKVVLEKLAKDGKVANFTIPSDSWIPVNTRKEFETAKLRLKKN